MNVPLNASALQESARPSVPSGYRERAEWFFREYGTTAMEHLANLCRFFPGIPRGKALSFVGTIEEGYVHAQYGAHHFYFPDEPGLGHVSAPDWMDSYAVEIDGKEIPLDTGIQEVRDEIESRAETALGGTKERLIAKLLPPRIESRTNSRNVMVKRTIRVRKTGAQGG